jgi:hypothetical protein
LDAITRTKRKSTNVTLTQSHGAQASACDRRTENGELRTPSQARLHANRANAQLSTGPRTQQGKAASGQNSFKHGLYSKQLVIRGEDPAELDALKADLIAEHQPATVTEEILVNEMAEHYWRLKRFRHTEATLLNAEILVMSQIEAVQRFMNSAERGFHKALKTLCELQKARGFVSTKSLAPAADPKTDHRPRDTDHGPRTTDHGYRGFVPAKPAVAEAERRTENRERLALASFPQKQLLPPQRR